jgi:peptidoglycan/xylan/chitin deacetylase (PgdA/CDA1 family)
LPKELHLKKNTKLVLISCLGIIFCVIATVSISLLSTQFASLNSNNVVTDNSLSTDNIVFKKVEMSFDELVTGVIDNFNIDYDVTPATQKAGTVRIPVLTYHQVGELAGKPKTRDYYVSPKILDEQMQYLSEKGYKTLTPTEFYEILKTGKNPKQKSVMLTFDDGNYNNYSNAFPILKKYGFTGVFYVPSFKRGINNAQLKEMVSGGMVIDPHGKTHMMLKKITDSAILYDELVNSKHSIESVTGQTSNSFCYPGCEYNGSVTSMLASNGYLIAFSCGTSIDHKPSGRFTLSRMHVYNDMNHFKSILSGVPYYPAYSD